MCVSVWGRSELVFRGEMRARQNRTKTGSISGSSANLKVGIPSPKEGGTTSRGSSKLTRDDFVPATAALTDKEDYVLKMANEISKAADKVRWFKQSEMSEFGGIVEVRTVSGFYRLAEVMGTSAAES